MLGLILQDFTFYYPPNPLSRAKGGCERLTSTAFNGPSICGFGRSWIEPLHLKAPALLCLGPKNKLGRGDLVSDFRYQGLDPLPCEHGLVVRVPADQSAESQFEVSRLCTFDDHVIRQRPASGASHIGQPGTMGIPQSEPWPDYTGR